ncbi:glutathionylspermidine synthase family protein [candidate division KSB1 bacterium]|nr:glutathionylspermidine synthase family protein [candidate division KSB1 bacterium]
MLHEIAELQMNYLIQLLKDEHKTRNVFGVLNEYLTTHNCTFRNAVMPTFSKPYFITPKQATTMQQIVTVMSQVLNKFILLYLSDKNLQRILHFSQEEHYLFSIDPGYSTPLVISRMDAFMNGYDIKFLEFNCDSPAGTGYADVMEDGFLKFLDAFPVHDKWRFRCFNRQEKLLGSLLHCYQEFCRDSTAAASPTIAIVDWEDVATLSEFNILKNYFEDRGYPTIITSPQKLAIKNDRLMANDTPIDIVYRRVITGELIQRTNEVADFIEAAKRKLVCIANPFRSYIVGNKKILALLIDPRFQHIYTREELNIINQCIPWTQILSDRKVTFNQFNVDLRTFIADNKDRLVLKPASSYGGKDVYIGNETDDTTWQRILRENIDSERWVVQEFVPIPEDIFPEISAERIHMKLKKVNVNPFALLGKYAGAITRISDNSVINVSAGGGLIPTITAAKK